jgi:eukaryotic-like serine/threonine-protein kinase
VKTCTTCKRLYPEERNLVACPVDGTKLVSLAEAPVPRDGGDARVGAALCKGRYVVYRRVADGGMGRVYQAYDEHADRSVAMKVLHASVAEDEVNLERFRREYELSRKLPHDHIVEVLAHEETEDGTFAIVMEYLEGEELRGTLTREKHLPPGDVVRLVSQIAMGLAEPHAQKIVHRDLKPENVFMCESDKYDGQVVKLLDFGSVRDNSEGAKKLTVMGTTIGSPLYMAPEQAQGLRSLDHRADVWSVAAIAYEALTGKVPFGGATEQEIRGAILMKDPEPPSVAGKAYGVPPMLDEIFELGLAKEAGVRIPTVEALADRVCAAYGLEGTHADWAYVPARDLAKVIEKELPAVRAAWDASRPAPAPEAPAFDDDMVMGVPKQSKLMSFVSRLWKGKGRP